jgi:hypothetical protein
LEDLKIGRPYEIHPPWSTPRDFVLFGFPTQIHFSFISRFRREIRDDINIVIQVIDCGTICSLNRIQIAVYLDIQ